MQRRSSFSNLRNAGLEDAGVLTACCLQEARPPAEACLDSQLRAKNLVNMSRCRSPAAGGVYYTDRRVAGLEGVLDDTGAGYRYTSAVSQAQGRAEVSHARPARVPKTVNLLTVMGASLHLVSRQASFTISQLRSCCALWMLLLQVSGRQSGSGQAGGEANIDINARCCRDDSVNMSRYTNLQRAWCSLFCMFADLRWE